MGIGDPVQSLPQFLRLVLFGYGVAFGNAKLRVVRWQNPRFADLLGPPAQMCQTVLDRVFSAPVVSNETSALLPVGRPDGGRQSGQSDGWDYLL
jgi:hypothetical protein